MGMRCSWALNGMLCLGLAPLLSACAENALRPTLNLQVHVSPQVKSMKDVAIAVLPFERGEPIQERSEDLWSRIPVKDAGNLVSDMFTTEFMRVPGWRLVERSQIRKVLQELDLSLTELIQKKSAQEIGKLLGVDMVAIGHVGAFYFSGNWAGGRAFDYSYSMRLVKTESGSVLISATVSEQSEAGSDVTRCCTDSVRLVVDTLIEKMEGDKKTAPQGGSKAK